VYDGWAAAHAKQGKHDQAVAVYRKAMRQYPGDESLVRAARDQWHVWAKAHMQKKEWDKAVEVYTKALQMFPRDVSLKAGLDRCQSEKRRAAKTVSDRHRLGLPPTEAASRARATLP
jgi:tetratricopeptide (TPR) repeat protein